MAETSARSKGANASRVLTENKLQMRFSALVLSKLVRDSGVTGTPISDTNWDISFSELSETISSDGASRASSGPSRAGVIGIT